MAEVATRAHAAPTKTVPRRAARRRECHGRELRLVADLGEGHGTECREVSFQVHARSYHPRAREIEPSRRARLRRHAGTIRDERLRLGGLGFVLEQGARHQRHGDSSRPIRRRNWRLRGQVPRHRDLIGSNLHRACICVGKSGIGMLELGSSPLDREEPFDSSFLLVAAAPPRCDFPHQGFLVRDSPVEALLDEHTNLDLHQCSASSCVGV